MKIIKNFFSKSAESAITRSLDNYIWPIFRSLSNVGAISDVRTRKNCKNDGIAKAPFFEK